MAQPKRAGTATNVHQEVMSFRMVELQQVAEMLHIKKGGEGILTCVTLARALRQKALFILVASSFPPPHCRA
jgi:hypothetical protein